MPESCRDRQFFQRLVSVARAFLAPSQRESSNNIGEGLAYGEQFTRKSALGGRADAVG
jgi:hypothetical protein